jgi:uncharacterized protein
MQTDLSHLPQHKQQVLSHIVKIIQSSSWSEIEMILLFGSYARGDWVEDKHDDQQYRYQSDVDLLVIVETPKEFVQTKLEREDVEFVNRRLGKAQYFFSDIQKEGILLFDSKKHRLREPKVLSNQERRKLALEDFNYFFSESDGFKKGIYSSQLKMRFLAVIF